jgi:four helix bundle protein
MFVLLHTLNKDFRFRDQIKAASGSIMDNISEGFGRGGNKEFINQLTISLGSATEVQSQLYRAYDYGYITETEFQKGYDLAYQVIQKAGNLITYLKNSNHKGQKFK